MISGFLEPPISTRQGLHGFNQGWFLVGSATGYIHVVDNVAEIRSS